MTRELSEIISDMRNIVKPYIAKQLKQLNFEHCGVTDKAEFETEFEMVLTLAEIANNQVTPQEPKTGHWIYDNFIWRCSECNETPKTMGYVGTADFMTEHFKFCNHCGAKMIEPQESEGEE